MSDPLRRPILRGKAIEEHPEILEQMHRRDLLKKAARGAVALTAGGLLVPQLARAERPRFPGMGKPGTGMSYDSGPSAKIHRLGEPARFFRGEVSEAQKRKILKGQASSLGDGGGINPDDLGNITNVLWGTGLYIGNEYYNWSDSYKAAVHAQVANWGFNFVCPKVGGYGYTWYGTDDQLRAWRDSAWNVGLGYAPFIYSVPSTYYRDAQICSEITNAVGIAVVDMEDEWAYQYSAMTNFGNVYRSYNPYDPIVVTGYGDPITRFGSGVFPASQMTAWADGYSPQWYFGVWSIYYYNGVYAAINWADNECGQTFGWSYPECPSYSIYSQWYGGFVPDSDLSNAEEYGWNWQAPIWWWEYSDMNDERAYYCQH
jgi:hypothetical protein